MYAASTSRALPAAGAVLFAAAIAAVLHAGVMTAPALFQVAAALVILAAGAYLVWHIQPAYIFCAALALSPLSGNWRQLGLPSYLALDRVLLLAGVASVLIGATRWGGRERLRIEPIHWLMLVTLLYATVSALVAGSLFYNGPGFKLLEAFGVGPFMVFLAAPVAFRTERHRDALLATFVALGAYLGLTAIFETVHLNALVFPKYILDPRYGTHWGHARGPFVEAVTNGFALYACGVASAIAWWRWRGRGRLPLVAAAVIPLCAAGAFMSLERSVWLSAGVATLIGVLAIAGARKYVALIVVALAVAVGASMLFIPGFASKVHTRANDQQTVWDRKNLNRAAGNMIVARPLFGFGWGQFVNYDINYFQQAPDYPITSIRRLQLHSTVLSYAVELGLVGALLWLASLVFAVGGALGTRGPPDLRGWRAGLLAIAICFMIVTNFVPPMAFPNLVLWLWAGVVWSGRYASVPLAALGASAR